VALGRRGGRVSSEAKTRAVRRNATLGGRKRKFQVGDRVIANDKAPGDYQGHIGQVTALGPGRSEYGVELDHRHGYLMSWWVDPA
jgi:hypothetical protein